MKFDIIRKSAHLGFLNRSGICGMNSARFVRMTMKKRILILDDEPSTRLLLRHFFSKGYELSIHENGLKGLDWLEKGNNPDLIITDLEMPEMDGFEFINRICSDDRFRGIQILVTSGLEEIEARKRIKYNCSYLQKSDQLVSLKNQVSKMLNEAEA
tara:strand:+ start:4330 stop:4797 length:468 start_codon:yes stop_codon:yes gene_type:complete